MIGDIMSDAEKMFEQLQLQNQQMQAIVVQKQTIELQTKEIDSALEELEKTKKADVFKSVGPILIKTTATKIKKELKEAKEDAGLKIKMLEKQEKEIQEAMEKGQKELQTLAKK